MACPPSCVHYVLKNSRNSVISRRFVFFAELREISSRITPKVKNASPENVLDAEGTRAILTDHNRKLAGAKKEAFLKNSKVKTASPENVLDAEGTRAILTDHNRKLAGAKKEAFLKNSKVKTASPENVLDAEGTRAILTDHNRKLAGAKKEPFPS
ncbi:uncharacterized protein LOC124172736 [Ischnura elegans]|uniref:uncharacterized protein LOC124172736 n=1 Tax=Ischnura elegans TaxID=197161 RepID=UPI001ED8874F|nr:uncharacterized protein LOC124172736 [Ischnura elegans]